jgi:hypothetical protein
VRGLKGLSYLDKSKDPKNPTLSTEARDAVTFGSGLVDSVYVKAPAHVELDVGTGACVCVCVRACVCVCVRVCVCVCGWRCSSAS